MEEKTNSVEKTFDEVCDELTEEDIIKIENISQFGTRLLCINNYNPKYNNHSNIRDYLKYRKDYIFQIGNTYTVSHISNDAIFISEESPNSHQKNVNTYRNPYIFDHFILESESIIQKRNQTN